MKYYIFFLLYLCIAESYQLPFIKRHIYPRDPLIKQIDNNIVKITKPATMNFIMNPIVGLVDGYWVNKYGDSTQLAGQASSEQLFNLYYTFLAFAPQVLTPIISRYVGENKKDKIIEYVNTATLLSFTLGLAGALLLFFKSELALNTMISTESPVFNYAQYYFKYRVIGLPFQLLNSCYYSVCRGKMDINSAVKINIFSQMVNILLDPLFMKKYGIRGVAIASTISDVVATLLYIKLLIKQKYISLRLKNFFKNSKVLLNRAFFVQLKDLSYQGLYFIVNQKLLLLDTVGKLSVSHVLLTKYLYINSILYYSLASAATVILPYQRVYNQNVNLTEKRFIFLAIISSIFQTSLLAFGKKLFSLLTKDEIVLQHIMKVIPIIGILIPLNAVSTVFDGILQGSNHYKIQFINAITSFLIVLVFSNFFSNLTQIWMTFSFLTLLRSIRSYQKYKSLNHNLIKDE
tara:strand:- start:1379 stop:2758 length:1380 start_codon:yes stop_codon:yes gene_type:complete